MGTRAIDRVVIINTTLNRNGDLKLAHKCLSVRTVEAGLRARGFRGEILLFPEQGNYYFRDVVRDPSLIVPELDGLVDSSQRTLIGFSAITDHFDVFRAVSELVGDRYLGVPRVGGGPLFMRQRNLVNAAGRTYRDPIEIILHEGLVDIAIDGHTGPLGPLVVDHNGDISKAQESGLYWLERGRVVGRGRGAYPQLDEIPHIRGLDHKGKPRFDVMFEALCRNACRFCPANRGTFGFSRAQALALLRSIRARAGEIGDEYVGMIAIDDSSPLAARRARDGSRWELLDVLAEFERGNPYYPNLFKSIFLDPSILVDAWRESEATFNNLVTQLFNQGVISIFFGRETPTAEIAQKIGRRYNNKVRSQRRLDAERGRLKTAIRKLQKLREQHHYPPREIPIVITISYIISPFETPESIETMLREAREFVKLGNELVKVEINFNPLIPYLGTPIARNFVDLMVNPERLDLLNSMANPWSASLGPNAALIDALTSPGFIGPASTMRDQGVPGAGLDLLEQLAERAFTGEIEPEPDADKKKRYVNDERSG